MRVRAMDLIPGDVTTGTGEKILSASCGIRTPRGKIDVKLGNSHPEAHPSDYRCAQWGKYTMIGIKDRGQS